MSNVEVAYDYFTSRGFTAPQAAGIVGNLIQESNVNPESIQAGGPGRGIAQWSVGGRWQPSLMTGNAPVDLDNQLQYITTELDSNPGYGLAALQQDTTPQQAALTFSNRYEMPSAIYANNSGREQNAAQILADAQQNQWGNATSTVTTGGTTVPADTSTTTTAPTIATTESYVVGGSSLLDSLNNLLNPSVTFTSPWNVLTMIFTRGAFSLVGMGMMVAGAGIIIMSFREVREVAGHAVGDAAKAALV
jgi:hypothetical protein